jgi:hypothetical protein
MIFTSCKACGRTSPIPNERYENGDERCAKCFTEDRPERSSLVPGIILLFIFEWIIYWSLYFN